MNIEKDTLPMQFNIDLNYDKNNKEKMIETKDFIKTEEYDPFNLKKRVKLNIKLMDCAKNSINIPDFEFSNMLPSLDENAADPYINMAIEKAKGNPKILLDTDDPVRYTGKNKDRIKAILCEYVSEELFDLHSDYFRKSDINTDVLLGKRGAFRVISLYLIEPKKYKNQRHSKHFLHVILMDPYHLFLPSKYNGLTADEYRNSTYTEIKEYNRHIGELL